MQSGGHPPDGVVAHDARQAEGGDHLGEGGVGRGQAQTQQSGETWGTESESERDLFAMKVCTDKELKVGIKYKLTNYNIKYKMTGQTAQ